MPMEPTDPVQPAAPPPAADPKPIPAPIPSDGSILTQEQASKLLRRDVANLVKKVTNGKPLTSTPSTGSGQARSERRRDDAKPRTASRRHGAPT